MNRLAACVRLPRTRRIPAIAIAAMLVLWIAAVASAAPAQAIRDQSCTATLAGPLSPAACSRAASGATIDATFVTADDENTADDDGDNDDGPAASALEVTGDSIAVSWYISGRTSEHSIFADPRATDRAHSRRGPPLS